jgi:hypothetical protein
VRRHQVLPDRWRPIGCPIQSSRPIYASFGKSSDQRAAVLTCSLGVRSYAWLSTRLGCFAAPARPWSASTPSWSNRSRLPVTRRVSGAAGRLRRRPARPRPGRSPAGRSAGARARRAGRTAPPRPAPRPQRPRPRPGRAPAAAGHPGADDHAVDSGDHGGRGQEHLQRGAVQHRAGPGVPQDVAEELGRVRVQAQLVAADPVDAALEQDVWVPEADRLSGRPLTGTRWCGSMGDRSTRERWPNSEPEVRARLTRAEKDGDHDGTVKWQGVPHPTSAPTTRRSPPGPGSRWRTAGRSSAPDPAAVATTVSQAVDSQPRSP